MLYITLAQFPVIGVAVGAFMAFNTKQTNRVLVEWLAVSITGDNKRSAAAIMKNGITVWQVLCRVGIAA
ncbi:hypothetical protein D3C73_1325180 [compost metagenome]